MASVYEAVFTHLPNCMAIPIGGFESSVIDDTLFSARASQSAKMPMKANNAQVRRIGADLFWPKICAPACLEANLKPSK